MAYIDCLACKFLGLEVNCLKFENSRFWSLFNGWGIEVKA